jgi:hypothetical protein
MKLVIGISTMVLFAAGAHAGSPQGRIPQDILRAMDAPSTMMLLSIHPDSNAAHWYNTKFQGYRVLGQVPITNPVQRRQITDTVKRVIQDYESGSYKCVFSPRHGIRITRGLQTYDFLICFECQAIKVYSGEREVLDRDIKGEPGVLSTFLRAARIRIAD